MTIDRPRFYAEYRRRFGPIRTAAQVANMETVLSFLELDPFLADLRLAAYVLATIRHETAGTFGPVREYGRGRGRRYGVPVSVQLDDGTTAERVYYGRGFVQITWETNYRKLGRALGLGDRLVQYPDMALDPRLSWAILSVGMRRGLFTGRRLADYIHAGATDFRNARRVVNGTDRAALIASYAAKFLETLTATAAQ